MAKKKKDLNDEELAVYRSILTGLDVKVAGWDNIANGYNVPTPNKQYARTERDAWIIARDALEKVVRREQERRVASED